MLRRDAEIGKKRGLEISIGQRGQRLVRDTVCTFLHVSVASVAELESRTKGREWWAVSEHFVADPRERENSAWQTRAFVMFVEVREGC